MTADLVTRPVALAGPSRRVVPDARDLWYLLADRPPQQAHQRVLRGPVYDQGEAPTGVACALLAALHASPAKIGPARTPTVEALDRLIRELEGALGPAVTIRSGCRALLALGLITGYAWSYEASEIAGHLASGHGLVLGVDWYANMDRPDRNGLIRAWGTPVGGHAVFAWGYDPLTDTVAFQNSRGASWGGWSTRKGRRDFKGCARLPLGDLKRLLDDSAEAVALVKNAGYKP